MQRSFYIHKDLLEWLEDQVREGKFQSVSAAVREAIRQMKNKETGQ